MSKQITELTTTVTPQEARRAIERAIPTGVAVFLWGAPGIAKSRIVEAIATAKGIAAVDFRLSQLDPTDLRGMPYPTKRGGREGVVWSVPHAMPQDLDLDFVVNVPDPTDVRVEIANPTGINGIHYCTDPRITLVSLNKHAEARIIDEYETDENGDFLYYNEDGDRVSDQTLGDPRALKPLDRVTIGLFDQNTGEPVAGKIRVKVRGAARGILMLEEFNSASQAVAAAAYQFVLDRRLGEYVVPAGVAIVAMGNRETDKGITYAMATPLANRFIHLEMRVSVPEWLEWAPTARVHPAVVGFISAMPDKLHQFDPSTASRGFATPRSWEFVSKIFASSDGMDDTIATALVCGAVGEGSGLEFMTHKRQADKLPNAEDILSGRLRILPEELDTAYQYTLTNTLVYNLMDEANGFIRKKGYKQLPEFRAWEERGNSFIDFVMKNFQPEMAVMACRLAMRSHKLPFNMVRMSAFAEFAETYRPHVMA